MTLIYARHDVFGVCQVPESRVHRHPDEWTKVDPPATPPGVFNPLAHNADVVVEHLSTATNAEIARVIDLERTRTKGPRKTVLAADFRSAAPAAPAAGSEDDDGADEPPQTPADGAGPDTPQTPEA